VKTLNITLNIKLNRHNPQQNSKMDEELRILTSPNGNGPIVISIGVPTGAPTDISNDTASSSRRKNRCVQRAVQVMSMD